MVQRSCGRNEFGVQEKRSVWLKCIGLAKGTGVIFFKKIIRPERQIEA